VWLARRALQAEYIADGKVRDVVVRDRAGTGDQELGEGADVASI